MTLPDPSEPLILADGTKIDPKDGSVIRNRRFVEVPSATEAVKTITQLRRRAADLPELPSRMNPISAVLCYELFGLDETQTAIASGFSVEQVTNIRMLEAYGQMRDTVVTSVKQSGVDEVRDFIHRHSLTAARELANLADDPNPTIRLSAVKDILDRAGQRPADVVEQKRTLDMTLVVEHVKRDTRATLPEIIIDNEE